MRVIAGKVKGRKLKAPSGLDTRPLTDMIKEALFNVWGKNIENAELLDLFAGSGSVGIEALSRGAQNVIFVDNSPKATRVIRENVVSCGFIDFCKIYRNDVFRAIYLLDRSRTKFDFIYVDPPFTNERIFDEVISTLDEVNILKEDGIMVIRTRRSKDMPAELEHLTRYRLKTYGESSLHYYAISGEVSDK